MQDKVKLLVFLAVWRRPEITELCFQGINRLRKHQDFDVQALAVISEPEMATLCNQYSINFVLHENLPLGKKKNYGLKAAKKFDFDYMMEIGSDDLVLSELLDAYKPLINERDVFGVSDLLHIDTATGTSRRISSRASVYGAGRMISRRALEKMNWTLWRDNLNQGMDNNSVFNMARNGIMYNHLRKAIHPMVIDVKGRENIWPFDPQKGEEYNSDEIIERLSADEKRTLTRIIQCNTALAK